VVIRSILHAFYEFGKTIVLQHVVKLCSKTCVIQKVKRRVKRAYYRR